MDTHLQHISFHDLCCKVNNEPFGVITIDIRAWSCHNRAFTLWLDEIVLSQIDTHTYRSPWQRFEQLIRDTSIASIVLVDSAGTQYDLAMEIITSCSYSETFKWFYLDGGVEKLKEARTVLYMNFSSFSAHCDDNPPDCQISDLVATYSELKNRAFARMNLLSSSGDSIINVLPESLYIASCASVTSEAVGDLNISTIFQLCQCDSPATTSKHSSRIRKIHTEDREEWTIDFDQIVEEISQIVAEGKKVLIHCQAGISRSATIVLALLMHGCGMTLAESHAHLLQRKPDVQPNMGFARQLISYEKRMFQKTRPTTAPLWLSSVHRTLQHELLRVQIEYERRSKEIRR